MNEIVFFEIDSGVIEVRVENGSVWLSQEQMASLFDRERSVITKHLRNVFREGELDRSATCAFFAQVQNEGGRTVTRQIEIYNLDAILSVGYRVNSRRGVQFRQWASRILKDYLVRGYALDRRRLETHAHELEAALKLVRATLQSPELNAAASQGLAEIIVRYTQTFLWLQRYDDGLLTDPKGCPGGSLPGREEALAGIAQLKADLMTKGQADGTPVVNDVGLAALSLLVAESKPADKDVLIRLTMNMLAGEDA